MKITVPIHNHVAVVIPCYKVTGQILDVISRIGPETNSIYVIDDCCPSNSGQYVLDNIKDERVEVIFLEHNQGVGGAVVSGMQKALQNNADIIVKLDGDGQYDPELIPTLITPIIEGIADYSKGNRFFIIENLAEMPGVRIFGNAALSFINKMVSGYWNIMDPTNGFLAVHGDILRILPLDKLDKRYFFESDLLFRLNTVKAVIHDVPLQAFYRDEVSSLSIYDTLFSFPRKHLNRLTKRMFYNYFLRDFNIGSLSIIFSAILLTSGTIYGLTKWVASINTGIPATAGMVMISGIQLLVGIHLLISFINFDVNNVPKKVQYPLLKKLRIAVKSI